MNIKKYVGHFHDGTILDIEQNENEIIFFLESSVIDPTEVVEKTILSRDNTLKGKLSLSNIKKIKLGSKDYDGVLKKTYDDGEILDLKLQGNKVLLLIEWKDFPPKVRINDVSKIEIEAEKIQWIPEDQ